MYFMANLFSKSLQVLKLKLVCKLPKLLLPPSDIFKSLFHHKDRQCEEHYHLNKYMLLILRHIHTYHDTFKY
jgi:hypothetical protein